MRVLFGLFEGERAGALVANFRGSPVLDGSGVDEGGLFGPFFAVCGESLEGFAVEFDEGLADHGFHVAVAAFHIHHHGDGHTAGDPLFGRCGGVLHDGHVAGLAVGDELRSRCTECVAVVGIEVGGSGAASFVTEEVVEGRELAYVFTFLLPGGELFGYHFAEELLGFDERNLYVAVGVAFGGELLSDAFGKRGVDGCIGGRKFFEHPSALLSGFHFLGLGGGKEVVELGDEFFERGDELDEAFGDEHRAEVVAGFGALGDNACDVSHHVVEALFLSLHFFGDEADVGLHLQGAFEGDVRSRATHEFDEVPVLASGVGVALDVTDHFCVSFASGVETERRFDLVVLEVPVNRLGATDHLHAGVLGGEVFGEYASVGVRVVPTDDDHGVDAEFADDFETLFELCFFFELRTTRTNHVETTGVAVFVDEGVGHFEILVINETAGAHEEAVELRSGVLLLETVIETANHVVTAGSLTAGEDDADVDGSIFLLFVGGFEADEGHAVGVGEECFDFFLIVNTLRGVSLYNFHVAAQTGGEFGAISRTSDLQCAFFHNEFKWK